MGDTDTDLVESLARFLCLLDCPRHLPVRRPMAEREMLWRPITAHNGRWFARCRLSQIAHANRHLRKSCYEAADNTASRFALTHVSNVCGLFPVRSSTTLVTLPKLSRPS
jgi:hypothetical protein